MLLCAAARLVGTNWLEITIGYIFCYLDTLNLRAVPNRPSSSRSLNVFTTLCVVRLQKESRTRTRTIGYRADR
jgi:hypothetical protein